MALPQILRQMYFLYFLLNLQLYTLFQKIVSKLAIAISSVTRTLEARIERRKKQTRTFFFCLLLCDGIQQSLKRNKLQWIEIGQVPRLAVKSQEIFTGKIFHGAKNAAKNNQNSLCVMLEKLFFYYIFEINAKFFVAKNPK